MRVSPYQSIRFKSLKSSTLAGVAMIALALGATPQAHAGKIVSGPSFSQAPNAPSFIPQGFGGWNLDNVQVFVNGTNSTYSEIDGSYVFDVDSDFSYFSQVDDGFGNVLGTVLAKDWPVGEPSGIKIVNDDMAVKAPKAQNCIMATSYLEEHFMDSVDPQQVVCSSPFQSHKRYKLAMLPSSVVGGAGSELGIDLVFNVELEAGSRDYQVFQKINNWTDGRLEGFKIEVGTGIGTNFVLASDPTSGVGVENLSLSVPGDVWDADQLATFSAGLFGPADPHHDRPPGFFDATTRAGFTIAEYPNLSGETDTLNSGAPLGSDYGAVPVGAADQFGPWLPNNMLPTGIFWDDDGNPETDAQLLAFYGFDPSLGTLGWMGGTPHNFIPVPNKVFERFKRSLDVTSGQIDDLVNIGLNYNVTVGDVRHFGGSFTIRITPKVDTSGAGVPAYVGATPSPILTFTNPDAAVSISPSPEFFVGDLLTARVGDADLNLDPNVVETVEVRARTSSGYMERLFLTEQGPNRGVFAANLPDVFSDVPAGTVVTLDYRDYDDGTGSGKIVKSVSTTAMDVPPPPSEDASPNLWKAVGSELEWTPTENSDAEDSDRPVAAIITSFEDKLNTFNR